MDMWRVRAMVAPFKLTGTSGPRRVSNHLGLRYLDYTTTGSLYLYHSLAHQEPKSQGSKYEHVASPCDVKSSEAGWHCDTSLFAPGFSTPRLLYALFSPSPLPLATRTRNRSQAQCFFLGVNFVMYPKWRSHIRRFSHICLQDK
jgi:hypothetical protein